MHLFPQFSKVIVTPQKPFDEEQFYFGRTKVDNNGSSQEEAYTHTCLRDACAICVCFSFRFIDQRRAKRKIKRMALREILSIGPLIFPLFPSLLSLSLFLSLSFAQMPRKTNASHEDFRAPLTRREAYLLQQTSFSFYKGRCITNNFVQNVVVFCCPFLEKKLKRGGGFPCFLVRRINSSAKICSSTLT